VSGHHRPLFHHGDRRSEVRTPPVKRFVQALAILAMGVLVALAILNGWHNG
jgi:hypothetical protein